MSVASVTPGSAQQWEAAWWGDCTLTFGEEAKQLTYAHRMGLTNTPFEGKWPCYDLDGRSVIDLGGGPVSMLLKTRNATHRTVVDPCPYPAWVEERYREAGIWLSRQNAEDYWEARLYDEVWIYNVLQHVLDPARVIHTALEHGRLLRIFEWVNTGIDEGHPHTLTQQQLEEWIGAPGTVEHVNENGAVGTAFHGAFVL